MVLTQREIVQLLNQAQEALLRGGLDPQLKKDIKGIVGSIKREVGNLVASVGAAAATRASVRSLLYAYYRRSFSGMSWAAFQQNWAALPDRVVERMLGRGFVNFIDSTPLREVARRALASTVFPSPSTQTSTAGFFGEEARAIGGLGSGLAERASLVRGALGRMRAAATDPGARAVLRAEGDSMFATASEEGWRAGTGAFAREMQSGMAQGAAEMQAGSSARFVPGALGPVGGGAEVFDAPADIDVFGDFEGIEGLEGLEDYSAFTGGAWGEVEGPAALGAEEVIATSAMASVAADAAIVAMVGYDVYRTVMNSVGDQVVVFPQNLPQDEATRAARRKAVTDIYALPEDRVVQMHDAQSGEEINVVSHPRQEALQEAMQKQEFWDGVGTMRAEAAGELNSFFGAYARTVLDTPYKDTAANFAGNHSSRSKAARDKAYIDRLVGKLGRDSPEEVIAKLGGAGAGSGAAWGLKKVADFAGGTLDLNPGHESIGSQLRRGGLPSIDEENGWIKSDFFGDVYMGVQDKNLAEAMYSMVLADPAYDKRASDPGAFFWGSNNSRLMQAMANKVTSTREALTAGPEEVHKHLFSAHAGGLEVGGDHRSTPEALEREHTVLDRDPFRPDLVQPSHPFGEDKERLEREQRFLNVHDLALAAYVNAKAQGHASDTDRLVMGLPDSIKHATKHIHAGAGGGEGVAVSATRVTVKDQDYAVFHVSGLGSETDTLYQLLARTDTNTGLATGTFLNDTMGEEVRLHGRMMLEAVRVAQRIRTQTHGLAPSTRVLLTGHGVGGAIATLAALHGPLRQQLDRVLTDLLLQVRVFSFGAPRMGNIGLVHWLDSYPLWMERIETSLDPMLHVPLMSAGYRTAGVGRVMLTDGMMITRAAAEPLQVLGDSAAISGAPLSQVHSMRLYAARVRHFVQVEARTLAMLEASDLPESLQDQIAQQLMPRMGGRIGRAGAAVDTDWNTLMGEVGVTVNDPGAFHAGMVHHWRERDNHVSKFRNTF